MSRKKQTRQSRAKRRAAEEGLGQGIETMYHRSKGHLLKLAKADTSRAEFERRQAQVGLASNVLGITAGGAALAAAAKNPALRPSKANARTAGPVSRRVMGKIKSAKGKKALIVGGAAGALGLQAANLGGDLVANRVLSRESGVGKSIEQSVISKSAEVRVTGHGVNIAKRNFDAEADRQRRLGLYAGAGLGTGVALGTQAVRGIKPVKGVGSKGEMVRGLVVEGGKKAAGRKAALAALAALSAGGGIAAYKRGISERNKPW